MCGIAQTVWRDEPRLSLCLYMWPKRQRTKHSMRLLSIEHSKPAYWADFVLYGLTVVLLAVLLVIHTPPLQRVGAVLCAAIGFLSWSWIEYALHRFVLHELPIFKDWHAAHHERPTALICTPTILSAMLIDMLIFMPALWLMSLWHAVALTFGVLAGYLVYAITHHAIHHWTPNSAWLRQRKYWHALHHRPSGPRACYGVTSSFWDHVFRSD